MCVCVDVRALRTCLPYLTLPYLTLPCVLCVIVILTTVIFAPVPSRPVPSRPVSNSHMPAARGGVRVFYSPRNVMYVMYAKYFMFRHRP